MIVDWNTTNQYNLILADPPWTFKTWSKKGEGKSAQRHYPCMSMEEIKNLPIGQLGLKDSLLWWYVTDPLMFEQMKIPLIWGYHYVTVGFTWIKMNKKIGTPFKGLGKYTRANPEMLLVYRKGTPPRPKFCPDQLVFAKIREHSRKPDKIIENLTQMYPDIPKLELFGRQETKGWDVIGNQIGKFKDLEDFYE